MSCKPFIHLIHSPDNGYFYDVNKNEILSISDDLYDYLEQLLNDGTDGCHDGELQEEIDFLKSMGFLSVHHVSRIEHPSTRYLRPILARKIHKITLQLTQSCNFRCKYCVYSENNNKKQRTHANHKMSWGTARRAIDFLCNHSIDSETVNIGFYGGEPLLAFDLMKRIVAYTDEKFNGKSHTFALTTNGSLLTKEIVEFLSAHDISTTISLDGPKEINDKNRVFANGKGTFETVIAKIHNISKEYPEIADKIQISMVIDPQNDFDCIDSIKYDLGALDAYKINSSIVDDIYSYGKVNYSDVYAGKEKYQEFLAFLNEFGLTDKQEISPITYQETSKVKNKIRGMSPLYQLPETAAPGGPCIPGQMRLFVSVDGNLYPCERVSEVSEVMKIGNLEIGFDYEKVENLLNTARLTKGKCSNCWAFLHCIACAKLADDGDQLSAQKRAQYCNAIRTSVHNNMRKMILFKEIPALYKQYL